ncbi:MAG TPA: hypothetical protein VMG34_08475 [Bacteroidota bacterium]|nr:hypothetical protein [Bacteroidota bacterium]
MNLENVRCEHLCRNTCAMLSAALAQETLTVRFYQSVLSQCDEPDVSGFVRGLVEERSASVIKIMQKLNELKARSQVMDGIQTSFQS